MSKLIIAIIVVVVIAIVLLGIYLFLSMGQQADNNQTANPNTFQIKGMKVEILKEGSGQGAKVGDSAQVHYVGTLTDGTVFDSSIARNNPYTFTIGGLVIQGWNEGVVGMKVGEKRRLTIPPEMAYGPEGRPPVIPQNATLTFEVELLKIN